MNSDAHLLIIEDDDRLRALLQQYLIRQGYRVSTATNTAAGRKLLGMFDFDLAIVDIMMPGEDGLTLLKRLRSEGNETPVLLLTAQGLASDRIKGLKFGADDYLPKPCEPEELSLRVAAILKRSHVSPLPETIKLSGRVFHKKRGILSDEKGHVHLTASELQLLATLAERPGTPISRENLAAQTSNGTERNIDVQITRLRKKIEPDPKNPIHIQTVRGIGYRLMPD